MSSFRVKLWAMGTNRGRGSLAALIDDANDIGISGYANERGEAFFTLPWNHPQISACQPLVRHVEVSRQSSDGTYTPIWVGILDDYSATRDEVVFYARDYLSLLETTISASNTSYTSTQIGTIIQDEVSLAIQQVTQSNSRLGFMTMSIETVTTTTSVLTSYQPRLDFIRGVANILQAGGTTRPLISVNRTSPFVISFAQNAGIDRNGVRLEYGGNIRDFLYAPGYDDLVTNVYAIGQQRQGANLLFSNQSYASPATYGTIQRGTLFIDVVNQSALDAMTLTLARIEGTVGKSISLSARVNGVAPWDGFDLMDSVRVIVNRGIVSVNNLFTVWGLEWIGAKNGSESLFLDLRLKLT